MRGLVPSSFSQTFRRNHIFPDSFLCERKETSVGVDFVLGQLTLTSVQSPLGLPLPALYVKHNLNVVLLGAMAM